MDELNIDGFNHYSQLGQDLWVQDILNHQTGGVFIEVGASNGIHLSNTYLLEQESGWNGLCVEPGKQYSELIRNRKCHVSQALVFNESNLELEFIDDEVNDSFGSFSGISASIDKHHVEGKTRILKTSTLTEVLEKLDFPKNIDYLSIDTEGSELQVLQGIDFETYSISLITVEHNWVEPKRSEIRKLLHGKGYQQDLFANSQFDDWYIHNSILENTDNPYFNRAARIRTAYLEISEDEESKNSLTVHSLTIQLEEKEAFIQQQNQWILDQIQNGKLARLRRAFEQLAKKLR